MMNAAVFVTEFGAPSVEDKLLEMLHQQEAVHPTGSTFWPWKERGGWGMFSHNSTDPTQPNGEIDEKHVAMLARVLPLAVAGRLSVFEYNHTSQTFFMAAAAPKRTTAAVATCTEIFVPAHVSSAAIRVVGEATLVNVTTAPDVYVLATLPPHHLCARCDQWWIFSGGYCASRSAARRSRQRCIVRCCRRATFASRRP